MHRKALIRTAVPLVALALTAAACGSSSGSKSSDTGNKTSTTTTAQTAAIASQTGAATLRAKLTSLLTEHVYLASKATGAALRGDMPGFNEWAGALNGPADSNTADLTGRDHLGLRQGRRHRVRRPVAERGPHPAVRRLHPGRGQG